MKIQVLGTGCPKCKLMEEIAVQAAKVLALDCEIEKVTDINKILSFGVMVTPALAVDGEVKIAGKLPKLEEMKKILSN